MSPSLFIIAKEVLSRGMKNLILKYQIKSYCVHRNASLISHALFANDTIIFMNAAKPSITKLIKFLEEYVEVSDQKINKLKSSFYLSTKTEKRKSNKIEALTGWKRNQLPFTYLGGPIFCGGLRIKYFNPVITRTRKILDGWKSILLSIVGRITLVCHVINNIPIHIMSVYDILKTIK